MFDVYVIQLPWNYTKRLMAFKNKEKAEQVLEALRKENPIGGSTSDQFSLNVMTVFDDADVEITDETK